MSSSIKYNTSFSLHCHIVTRGKDLFGAQILSIRAGYIDICCIILLTALLLIKIDMSSASHSRFGSLDCLPGINVGREEDHDQGKCCTHLSHKSLQISGSFKHAKQSASHAHGDAQVFGR